MMYYFLHWPQGAEGAAIITYIALMTWCLRNKNYIVKCSMEGVMPIGLRMVKWLGIITSIYIIWHFPLLCLAWLVVGATAYPIYCMFKHKELDFREAMAKEVTQKVYEANKEYEAS